MGVLDHKRWLFDGIVRLRRVEREMPGNRDIAVVRAGLEAELGETISRRLAASLLGVSHTALARWIRAGDLAVVQNAAGREELPVATLIDLYDAVTREREVGSRRRHLLEPTMSAGRERARRLRARDLVPEMASGVEGHRRAELRSLAYHRAVARRLRRSMIDEALLLVWKWRDQGTLDPHYADRWEAVLRLPVADVRRIIGQDSAAARSLRQSSPFAGMLSEPERRKILDEVR